MIDCENKVLNDVQTAISTAYSNCAFYSEEVRSPSKFPCVVMYEEDNYLSREQIDSSSIENFANVSYIVNVYSNKKSGKKEEAKAICSVIDEKMLSLGFRRTMHSPMPNVDITICRYTMRYVAVINEESAKKYRIYQ